MGKFEKFEAVFSGDQEVTVIDKVQHPLDGWLYRVKHTNGTEEGGWTQEDRLSRRRLMNTNQVRARLDEIKREASEGDWEAVSGLERSLYVDYLKQLAANGDKMAALILLADVEGPRW